VSESLRDAVDVSIIVIAHDVRDEVLLAFESVYRYSAPLTVQCILVDNASTDGTAEAVAERFPDVEIIRRPTNECLPGRNHGLRAARGRYRMFLDSDAALTPGALQTLVDVLETSPKVGLVGPRLVYGDGSLQLSTRRYPPVFLPFLRRPPLARFFENGRTIRRHLMADEPHDRRRTVEYVLGACMLFRAEAQAAIGEIDSHIWFGHDDADWCFRMRNAGYEVVYVPEAEVVHDYRRTSAKRPLSLFSLRFLMAHVYFQWKWWSQRRRLRAEGAVMDRLAYSTTSLR
jgi:N-acetylglucosaminyl-diphospho-decaprenol L-rhamnosyltransferase